jgi:hypothetical protein
MKHPGLSLLLAIAATGVFAAPPSPTDALFEGPADATTRHVWQEVRSYFGDWLEGTIPEVPFQIRSTKWFFERYAPTDFEVARPESFEDMSHFIQNDLFYEVDADVETTFAGYMATNPLQVWSTRRARIVAAWSPSLGETLDREGIGDRWPGFEEGMRVWVDMASNPVPITNKPAIMVALRVVRIDPEEKLVVFRYMEGTPSYGEQRISFRPHPEEPGRTAISHITWFRAYGKLIEKLYPRYHKWMIDSMHAHFRTAIEG